MCCGGQCVTCRSGLFLTGHPSRLPWSATFHWSGRRPGRRHHRRGGYRTEPDEDEDENAFGRVYVRACCGADGEVGTMTGEGVGVSGRVVWADTHLLM